MSSTLSRQRLAPLPVTFTTAQARSAGIAPRDLYLMRDEGVLHELSRGVFRAADAPMSAHLDLIAVAARSPAAVVCLESALALHELIDDIPTSVHIAVPRDARRPNLGYPPVTVSRFDPATFDVGIELFEAAPGEHVRVYSAARSVVDAMRLRHRFGETLAYHALGRYLRTAGQAGVPELLDMARLLGVEGPLRTAVEAVLA
jgi:predicted transcriptional regulator of viral defense system